MGLRTFDPKECAACGDVFVPWQRRQRCCSTDCGNAFFNAIRHWHVSACRVCGREMFGGRARLYCGSRCVRAAGRVEALSSDGLVYFVQAVSGGPIKVGHTRHPKSRMSLMQTGHPEQLVYLALVAGGALLEREIHDRLAAHRLRGEWFEPTPEVLAVVGRYSDQLRLVA